jgi:eukaryotic-like serine/threonine-protein kinase
MPRSVPSPRSAEVPLDTTQARTFYQGRIALFAKVMGLQSMGFLLLVNVIGFSFNPSHTLATAARSPSNHWHLAAGVASFAMWIVLARRAYGVRLLSWLDAAASVPPMILYAVMGYTGLTSGAPVHYVLLLICNLYQLARAVIVPSEPRYTALIGLAMCAPAVAIAWLVGPYVRHPPGAPAGLISASFATLWCLSGLITATFGSHVIYGLRREVREARRLGQYTLVEKIGEGGMGAVYKAHHALLRRPTAVKLLPPDKAGAHNLSRFEREVQITSQLTHPNTIAIYDYGRTPDGIFYYAMEYLEGLNLQELVEIDGPQRPARVVHILAQVSGALAEAHAVGLVHRDIKPANIILCERGGVPDTAKVVDFGLVKELDSSASVGMSAANIIMGTPLYLSPEAIVRPESVDGRSDLYALGAVAYFLLTGSSVYEGHNVVEVCGQHLHGTPVKPSERLGHVLPKDLERVVLSCLAKDPAERPASAAELRDALLACSIPRWTEDEAWAWWEACQRPLSARKRTRSGSRQSSLEATIAIDLQARSLAKTEVA